MNDVVVTGLGVRTCLGNDIERFWDNLTAGRSGIVGLDGFGDLPDPIGGRVDLDGDTSPRRATRADRMLRGAVVDAASMAFGGAEQLPGGTGIVVGTGGGGYSEAMDTHAAFAARGWKGIDRLSLLRALPNMPAASAAQELGIEGPCMTLTTACAASTDAAIMALDLIRSGRAEVVVVGGVETWLTPVTVACLLRLQVASRRPSSQAELASRPFDAERDGMVPAEGSGAFVLERAEHARARSAKVLGRILGGASTCDAANPVAARPDAGPAAAAVRAALADAGVAPSDIDHVSLHGTSTAHNDAVETSAIKLALGARATQIPMTAPKSMLGHAGGACGVIEMIAAFLTIERGCIPPTINLETPDPACDLDYTPLRAKSSSVELALSTNFGLGGQNAAIVLAGTS